VALLDRLEPDHLHLVVLGPGRGEAIAVRVPPTYWLAVDSAEVATPSGYVPAFRLLEQLEFKSAALVLTHPHRDHTAGFAELVNEHQHGPIGCSRCWTGLDAPASDPDDADAVLVRGRTEAAIAAVQDRWARQPDTEWDLVQGAVRELGDARVRVLYPDAEAVERYRMRGGDENALSSPLLIEWRGARILLGADLPRAQWSAVERAGIAAPLSDHHTLKIPHHGSKRSLHGVFAAAAESERLRPWVLAPWTRLTGPPTFTDHGDVAALLTWTTELHFTCISRRLRVDLKGGDRITRSEIAESIERNRFGDDLVLELEQGPRDETESWIVVSIAPDGSSKIDYGRDARVVVSES
jgi:beta-lactamase superfamily II metal-dependent hydrolase